MNDEKNFLERWARRKREVANEDAKEKARSEAPAPAQDAGPPKVAPTPAAAEPAFDLSKLPSLDSIVADSDITAFLQPGVPSGLKHAALRRAWVADPAIRDFIGPADYAWDFTAADSMPGFGALGPEDDVQKLVAEVFRDATAKVETPPTPDASSAESPEPEQPPAQIASAADAAPPDKMDPSELLQREENIASQQDEKSSAPVTPLPRRHGGAMPQ